MEHLEEERSILARPARRPVGVTILGVLVAIAGFSALASGAPPLFFSFPWSGPLEMFSLVLAVFAWVYFVAAVMLLSQTARTWWFAMTASAVVLVSSIGQMVFLGRVSFTSQYNPGLDPVSNGLALGFPIALFVLVLIILVGLVALRGHFGIVGTTA